MTVHNRETVKGMKGISWNLMETGIGRQSEKKKCCFSFLVL